MELNDLDRYYRRRIEVTCFGGAHASGLYDHYQSFADEPDEPECISLLVDPESEQGFFIDVPVHDI